MEEQKKVKKIIDEGQKTASSSVSTQKKQKAEPKAKELKKTQKEAKLPKPKKSNESTTSKEASSKKSQKSETKSTKKIKEKQDELETLSQDIDKENIADDTQEEQEIADNEKQVKNAKKSKSKKSKKEDIARTSRRASKKFNTKVFSIVLVSVIGGFAVLGGLGYLIYSLIPGKKCSTPKNLTIVQNDTSVYAVCDKVQNATIYTFNISGKLYQSNSPIFDLSVLSELKQYSIKVCCRSEKKDTQSAYTKTILYDSREKLETPIIHFKELNSSEIVWAKVPNATNYKLYYNDQTKDLGNVLSFDLNTLGGGAYVVSISATTQNTNYIAGNNSNQLTYECYETLKKPKISKIDSNSVRIDKVENATGYNVKINAITFGLEKFDEIAYIFDVSKFINLDEVDISYVKVEAIGRGYFVSNYSEITNFNEI